jgi:hypothetical protein
VPLGMVVLLWALIVAETDGDLFIAAQAATNRRSAN